MGLNALRNIPKLSAPFYYLLPSLLIKVTQERKRLGVFSSPASKQLPGTEMRWGGGTEILPWAAVMFKLSPSLLFPKEAGPSSAPHLNPWVTTSLWLQSGMLGLGWRSRKRRTNVGVTQKLPYISREPTHAH